MSFLQHTEAGKQVMAERKAFTAGYQLGLRQGLRRLDIERIVALVAILFSMLTGFWLGRF